MPLSFRTAARTEALLDAFVADVRDRPLDGALARETVVVGRSTALRACVESRLAHQIGCAASVGLTSPREFVADLARRFALVPPAPGGRAYEASALAWRIARLLPTLDGPTFAPLAAYLDRQAETERPGGTFALATRLAAAFDDYQVYRPAVLDGWGAGQTGGGPHEAWQAELWRRLVAEPLVAPDGTLEIDRATMVRRLTDRLAGTSTTTLPRRVSLIGTPLLPPSYLRVLVALAEHVPVTIYAVVPGRDGVDAPPFGAPARHPLLHALGGHTRDTADLFDQLGVPAAVHLETVYPAGPQSALHTIQAALATDTPPAGRVALDPADRSLRVLDAHSPLREIEALRDEIYDAFETIPGLKPSDVAILVPDLPTYAPLVEAVFATAAPAVAGRKAPAMPLPVHVADPPRGAERLVLDAFDRLLGLLDARATASDVLGLLDVPAVRCAAGLDEFEIATVHAWVRQTRVHWGRDADHRASHAPDDDAADDIDDGDLHTWRFGLDRLLLGVLTGPTESVVMGRRPVGEGTLDAADLLGRLAEWLDALFAALDALRDPRPLAEWADALLRFVDRTLAPEGSSETGAVVALRAAADRLATLRPPGADPGDEPAVSLGEVQAHLGHALATVDRDEPYLTGRITVVDPTAARHVPFRVIAFVGLGDAYPRSESRPAFDLLAAHAEPGDPDPAGTDRQTFLDAVLATRDRLIVTLTGRSQRDGTERAASSVLDALLDTCAMTFDAPERLVVRHRLQPFSPAYFAGDGDVGGAPLYTYAAQNRPASGRPRPAVPFFDPPPPDTTVDDDGAPVETTVDALAASWAHPVRAFCRARGLRPDLADADVRDDAPAELDALDLYALKDGLLTLLASGETPASAYDALRGTGVLPPGALGRAWFDHAHGLVAAIAERAGEVGVASRVSVEVEDPAWRVSGTLLVAPGGVLRVRAGKVRPRDLVGGWAAHLAASASGAATRTVVVGQDRAAAFAPVAPDAARAVLQALVCGAQAFSHAPVPLFELASFAYADTLWKQRRRDMTDVAERLGRPRLWAPVRVGNAFAVGRAEAYEPALAAARKAYDDPYNRCDATDAYIALCYRHLAPADAFPDALDRWARTLWAPLMAALEA